jgi:hypothetical protein
LDGSGTNGFEIYDIAADTWTAGPNIPRDVWGAAAAAWDGKIYFAGGDDNFLFGGTSDQVDIYDIATGTWSTGAAMPFAANAAFSVQTGQYLYMAGGWGDSSPAANITVTQRYDLSADTWTIGPAFTPQRADGSMAATSEYLYTMGGDADGNGAFDSTSAVEVLDWSAWPGGTWTSLSDTLPLAVTAQTGGFCTDTPSGSSVWDVGGFGGGSITNTITYLPSAPCFAPDIPWLSEDPSIGTVDADSASSVEVTFDTMTYTLGTYTGTLRVVTHDPNHPIRELPVTMHIVPVAYGVEITSPTAALTGTPGSVVTYTLIVTSTGNAADTFDLTLAGNNWPSVVTTPVGPLLPGKSVTVYATVSIPAGAADGDSDNLTVTATSQGDNTKTDTVALTTTAKIASYNIYLPLIMK